MKVIVFQTAELNVIQSDEYVFLLSAKDVANGYDVSESIIKSHRQNYKDEFTEGKHYIIDYSCRNTPKTMWTKRGIVKLGFFIKSQRAQQFRDWAENFLIDKNHLSGKQSKIIYQLERENIEPKQAMNRIMLINNLSSFPWAMNDFLDFLAYTNRTIATIRELAGIADDYASKGEDFFNQVQKYFKNTVKD
jgi:prophage antirepressor-like protein